jgi:hypothetical protein
MRAAALAPESQEEFEKRCKQFAPAAELAGIRQECLTAEHQMDAAVDREDYVAAAMYRDDLRELQAKDPAEAARQMREQMDLAVKREDYDAACMYRDFLRVLRRFLPQYQLAGLWKGTYPNHGEELIRVRYDGDSLYATKVTGDEHVPAGEVTFRAELADPCKPEQRSSGEDMAGVRVEVVSLSSDGAPQQREVERYVGEGCIAARGFQHAHYVPGQLFLMDTDVLGFLWLPLGTLVVFNRVPEDEERREAVASTVGSASPDLGDWAGTLPIATLEDDREL